MAIVQRLSTTNRNPVNARNFSAPLAEIRRTELQKARQNFQQNSFMVNSPAVVYYQQIRNGHACTCHAFTPPVMSTSNYSTAVNVGASYTDVSPSAMPTEIEFSTVFKSPLFGQNSGAGSSAENVHQLGADEDLLLDDIDETTESKTGGSSLFPNLFHKGTDCGICFRTGYTPLLAPVGRQFIVLTTHNVKDIAGYKIDYTSSPNKFEAQTDDCYVTFELPVPYLFKTMKYRIYDNTSPLADNVLWTLGEVYTNTNVSKQQLTDLPLTIGIVESFRGQQNLEIKVKGQTFTHVFIEFDLGIDVRVNFPQFSVSKDYSSFFNLQSVTIELPPTISNPQINDFLVIKEWDRIFQIFDVQPMYDSPLQQVLIKTTVQGRLVQTIETPTILKHLQFLNK